MSAIMWHFEMSDTLNQHPKKKYSWSVRLYLGTLWLFNVSLGWLSISCSKKKKKKKFPSLFSD